MSLPVGSRRPNLVVDRRLRLVITAAIALFSLHNLFPYLGLRYESCQTMFSGLRVSALGNNHLLMPQKCLSEVGAYFAEVGVRTTPPPTKDSAADVAWLNRSDQYVNSEAIRVVLHRLCARDYRVHLRLRQLDGHRVELSDACRAPRFSQPSRWIPIRLYAPSLPTNRGIWEESQPWLPQPVPLTKSGR